MSDTHQAPLRRRLLAMMGLASLSAAAGGAAAADAANPGAGSTAGSRSGSAGSRVPPAPSIELRRKRSGGAELTLDMAILGHTDAPNSAGRIGDPRTQEYFRIDTRGDNYFVEGVLYPGGTIPAATVPTPISVFRQAPPKLNNQVVWDFKAAKPIGHYFDRGWVLINGNRTPYVDVNGTVIETARSEPHMLSEHTFVLDLLRPDNLSPEMLITKGLQNGNDPDVERLVRAVVGGTGRFAHASGEVLVTRLGRNTTPLRSFSNMGNVMSPNYRFEFDLRLS